MVDDPPSPFGLALNLTRKKTGEKYIPNTFFGTLWSYEEKKEPLFNAFAIETPLFKQTTCDS